MEECLSMCAWSRDHVCTYQMMKAANRKKEVFPENKKEIGWLKEWSLTITILGAMIITALV